MDGKLFLNLTYSSPHEDFANSLSVNPDGTVSAKHTLVLMKDMLIHNVKIIEDLIETSDHITNIIPIAYGTIEVNINTPHVREELINKKIVTTQLPTFDTDGGNTLWNADLNETDDASDEETNNDRLKMIYNLINQNEFENTEQNDDVEEETEIVADETNMNKILMKYMTIFDNETDQSEEDN